MKDFGSMIILIYLIHNVQLHFSLDTDHSKEGGVYAL